MLIPLSVFQIARLTDVESRRYTLDGVRFERDANGVPLAIACDGRALIVVSWEEPHIDDAPHVGCHARVHGFNAVVPREACRQVVVNAQRKHALWEPLALLEERSNDPGSTPIILRRQVTNEQIHIECQPLEGRYPNWRDVINTWRPATEAGAVSFMPPLLRRTLGVCRSLVVGLHDSVTITLGAKFKGIPGGGAMRITGKNSAFNLEFTALVMPAATSDETRESCEPVAAAV